MDIVKPLQVDNRVFSMDNDMVDIMDVVDMMDIVNVVDVVVVDEHIVFMDNGQWTCTLQACSCSGCQLENGGQL